MHRTPHCTALLLLLALPGAALAQTAALTAELREGAEPQLRAEAARALGASADPEALTPLCAALEDTSDQVRVAAAQALATLRVEGALQCLQARSKQEPAPAVKKALQQALKALSQPQGKPRLYVALDRVQDKTGSLSPQLLQSTEERLRRKLTQVGALLAPAEESAEEAKKVLRKLKVQGYRLLVEIRPEPEGGLRLALVCMRYPGKQLLGTVGVNGSGAEPPELLEALVPHAVEEAAATFTWGK